MEPVRVQMLADPYGVKGHQHLLPVYYELMMMMMMIYCRCVSLSFPSENMLRRHVAVAMETIRKGIQDADAEARSVARRSVLPRRPHRSPHTGSGSLTRVCASQVLLAFPRSLPAGGGASVPGPGVVLSEGSAGSPEERRGRDPRSLVLLLAGEPEVSRLLLSDWLNL